jgi:radical SAM superfamily enzyme YgiQ (UPF0313 family)
MRVLLINSNRTTILEPVPPVGLGYVASAARAEGHDVRFLDLMTERDPERALQCALLEGPLDVVGISVRNIDNVVPQRLVWTLGGVGEIVAAIRARTAATIVLGGPAISILGASSLERFDADFAVVGEGETVFLSLMETLEQGADHREIPGLCWRGTGGCGVANEPERDGGFGRSGMEQWVAWKRYEKRGATWPIHTKRGCPLRCIYCNYPAMDGRTSRVREIGEVVDEIEEVHRTVHPRTFEITDGTFNVPSAHAEALCEEIIRRGLKVNLSAVGVNPVGVTPGLFALMKRAGFIAMIISADSADDGMLKSLGKGFDRAQLDMTARWARESGLRATWFFLVGGPGETRESVEASVAFAERELCHRLFATVFMTGIRLLPGTRLTEQLIGEGLLDSGIDLAQPVFYFADTVDEEWVLARITEGIGRCPTIAHGAEETGSAAEQLFYRLLSAVGAPPPYWRFLPDFLRIPPIPALRRRHNGVKTAKPGLFVGRKQGPLAAWPGKSAGLD